MGTPEFAVAPLKLLFENSYNIVGVVTAPDKPAGRGLQLGESAVKKFAIKHGLKILQPTKLKEQTFIDELRSLNADLQVVVAFRMLPDVVWKMPPKGTFNLHASLLPQYRGAAPINWAIINGEKETGVTTFFLQSDIDTGNIILQEKTPIGENETAGELHDKLMNSGAELVLKTVKIIESNNINTIKQSDIISKLPKLKDAPKIFKDDCKINWTKTSKEIHNLIRGLSPYPSSYTQLLSPSGEIFSIKIYKTEIAAPFFSDIKNVFSDNKKEILVRTTDGAIRILELQLAGKKRMNSEDFLKGFKLNGLWQVI